MTAAFVLALALAVWVGLVPVAACVVRPWATKQIARSEARISELRKHQE